jgi:hypothetical protein
MKNMKLILMALLLVLLAACGGKPLQEEDKKNGAPRVENNIPSEEVGVKAELKLEESSNDARFALINRSDKEIGTGTAYVLEKWTENKWVKVNGDQMFTEQMIVVKAGLEYEHGIELKDLTAGTYRVTKTFFKEDEKHTIAVVFERK